MWRARVLPCDARNARATRARPLIASLR
jgi:hypothetical protein